MNEEFSQKLFDFYRDIHVTMEKIFEKVLSEEDLSGIQLSLILAIHSCGELPVGKLSHIAGMNSGNCSSMCKRMEALGLIERRRGTDDERIVSVTLTAEGEATAERIFAKIRQQRDHFCGSTSDEDMDTVMKSMDIVSNYLRQLV